MASQPEIDFPFCTPFPITRFVDSGRPVNRVAKSESDQVRWCSDIFGDPGENWIYSIHEFRFKTEEDLLLFKLRWR